MPPSSLRSAAAAHAAAMLLCCLVAPPRAALAAPAASAVLDDDASSAAEGDDVAEWLSPSTSSAVAWLTAVQVTISLVSWAQSLLTFDRWRWTNAFSAAEFLGLGLYLVAAAVRVVAGVATAISSLAVQLLAAVLGSLLAWSAFLIVYNDAIRLPSRQQFQTVALGVVSTFLWEMSSRLVVRVSQLAG